MTLKRDHRYSIADRSSNMLVSSRVSTLVLALVAVLIVLALHGETVAQIVETWLNSTTFTHGFVVVPLSVYLIWRRRSDLAQVEVRASGWGLIALIGLTALWLVARDARVQVVEQFAVVGMVPATILAVVGTRATSKIAFPLLFLLFAVPAGEGIVPGLMEFTADFAANALQLTGIPVYREGMYMTIPGGTFEVTKSCSGVRYLFAALTVGAVYAYLSYRTVWRGAAFMGLAVVTPIIANGLRAYGIIVLAHLTNMKLGADVDHLIYGWVFFGLVMAVLFSLGQLLRGGPAEAASEPSNWHGKLGAHSRLSVAAAAVGSILIVGAGRLMLDRLPGGSLGMGNQMTAMVPVAPALWEGPLAVSKDWQPNYQGATAVVGARYRRGDASVDMFIASYNAHSSGELVSSMNAIADWDTWRRLDEDVVSSAFGEKGLGRFRETTMEGSQHRRLVWHWYEVKGRHIVSGVLGKLLGAWDGIGGGTQDSALVAVGTTYEGDADRARDTIAGFLKASYQGIKRCAGTTLEKPMLCVEAPLNESQRVPVEAGAG